MKAINLDVVRTEILRVRFNQTQDQMFRKFCNSLGAPRATVAHQAILNLMSGDVRPSRGIAEEANKRPLRTRQKAFPGQRADLGGAPRPARF